MSDEDENHTKKTSENREKKLEEKLQIFIFTELLQILLNFSFNFAIFCTCD